MGLICAKDQNLNIVDSHITLNTRDKYNYDKMYKIIMLGESNVGKTSFCERTFLNNFDDTIQTKPTIGLEFREKIIEKNNVKAKICIWDTAGQDKYRAIISAYYRNADAIILMYDSTNKSSFEKLDKWLDEIDKYLDKTNVIFVLAANKSNELINTNNNIVHSNVGKTYANDINAEFFEISVKDNFNCDNLIKSITDKLIESNKGTNKKHNTTIIKLEENESILIE